MGETIGVLKVMIVNGKKLVIRDFKSSDPYVVVKVENQVMVAQLLLIFHAARSDAKIFQMS